MQIIKDTREQKGYDFEFHNDIEIINKKLDCGDYALYGNNQIIVERKANTGEFYTNLGTQKERTRFYKECERLVLYDKPIILLEFPELHLHEFPKFSGIPKGRWPYLKMTGSFLRKTVYELQENFPKIQFVHTENKLEAENYLVNLFMEATNGYKKFDF